MIESVEKHNLYQLLNKGLDQKYCKQSGPIQEISISYTNKECIRILEQRKYFDSIEIDFVGDFIEEKRIYADFLNPIIQETQLNGIEGTLFIENDEYEDLFLELDS